MIEEINGEPSNGIIYARNPDGSDNISEIVSYGGVSTSVNFIPEHVKSINRIAFWKNSLESVIIPNNVISIGIRAFCSNNLSSVSIPNSVTFIGGGAFNENSIEEVNGNPSDGLISGRKSDGSEDLLKIVSYGGKATEIDFIPNSVKTIANYAFYNSQISSIILPEELITIEDWAFYLNYIESVVLPNNVIHIGDWAFCANRIKNIDFPSSLNTLGYSAFSHNDLESIHFSKNITQIGDYAFTNNTIETVELNENLISIGAWAFAQNPLSSFELPTHCLYADLGWTDQNENTYQSGETVDRNSANFHIPDVYAISFNPDGGINSEFNPVSFHKNDGVNSFQNATRPGYIFTGWFNSDNERVTSIPPGTEEHLRLYAGWEIATDMPSLIDNKFTISPNPATTRIKIKGAIDKTYEIYSISGKLIHTGTIKKDSGQIDVSALSNGIYIVKVGTKNERLLIHR